MEPVLLSLAFGGSVYFFYEWLTNPLPPSDGKGWSHRMEEFLIRAGLRDVTPREFLLFSCGAALAGAIVAQLLLGWPLVSLLVGALGLVAPVAYYTQRHDRRRAAVQAALVEAIAQLRDGIRAGLSVEEALGNLGSSGPDILRPEFAALTREARYAGFEQAIGSMRDRLADPVFDITSHALLLNSRLGGRSVTQVLDRLVQATRAELRVQQELQAYQAKTVLSARIVAAVPLVLLVVIHQVAPAYLIMFEDWAGQLVLAGCAVSILVGYAGMRWMTRLPGEPRVLQP